MPITFAEASLGTTLTVPTLDGTVSLKVPAATAARVNATHAAGDFFAGQIDDVQLYQGVLTQDQITLSFADGLVRVALPSGVVPVPTWLPLQSSMIVNFPVPPVAAVIV